MAVMPTQQELKIDNQDVYNTFVKMLGHIRRSYNTLNDDVVPRVLYAECLFRATQEPSRAVPVFSLVHGNEYIGKERTAYDELWGKAATFFYDEKWGLETQFTLHPRDEDLFTDLEEFDNDTETS